MHTSRRSWEAGRPRVGRRGARAATAAVLAGLCAAPALPLAGQADPTAPLTLSAGPLRIEYWPGHERLARRLLAAAEAAGPLPALPPAALAGAPVRVVLAPDASRFAALAGGSVPEWGAGIADPERDLVVLPAFSPRGGAPHELARTLRHELAHIALHRHLAPARVPRWFDEGFASWASGEWDRGAAWQLQIAFALHRAPPLDSIALEWPDGETDARLAYLLSATAVAYLAEHGGVAGLERLLARWKEMGAFEPALRRTYGFTLSGFEAAWQAHVRRRYGWLFVLSHSVAFWAFAALLLLALFAARRRRDRAALERLRATEPPDEPPYWLSTEPEQARETTGPAEPPQERAAPPSGS